MECRASMAMFSVVGMIITVMGSSEAYFFNVGGDHGWAPNPPENFNLWAETNRFQINDSLVFKYKKGEDSVLLVNQRDYQSCKTDTPIEERKSGSSVVKLRRSGPFFFISGLHGRCRRGQKLIVVVLAPRLKINITSAPFPAHSPEASPAGVLPSFAAPPMSSSPATSSTGASFMAAFMALLGGLVLSL